MGRNKWKMKEDYLKNEIIFLQQKLCWASIWRWHFSSLLRSTYPAWIVLSMIQTRTNPILLIWVLHRRALVIIFPVLSSAIPFLCNVQMCLLRPVSFLCRTREWLPTRNDNIYFRVHLFNSAVSFLVSLQMDAKWKGNIRQQCVYKWLSCDLPETGWYRDLCPREAVYSDLLTAGPPWSRALWSLWHWYSLLAWLGLWHCFAHFHTQHQPVNAPDQVRPQNECSEERTLQNLDNISNLEV